MTLPSRQASATEQQLRKAYLKRAYEDGFQDGQSGRLRATASYFADATFEGDDEAMAQYRYGLRIGRREKGRA